MLNNFKTNLKNVNDETNEKMRLSKMRQKINEKTRKEKEKWDNKNKNEKMPVNSIRVEFNKMRRGSCFKVPRSGFSQLRRLRRRWILPNTSKQLAVLLQKTALRSHLLYNCSQCHSESIICRWTCLNFSKVDRFSRLKSVQYQLNENSLNWVTTIKLLI